MYGAKSQRGSSLGNSRTFGHDWYKLPVKVNFESQSGSVKYGAAILAVAKVVLDLSPNLSCESSFEIFADQADRSLAGHAHGEPPVTERT